MKNSLKPPTWYTEEEVRDWLKREFPKLKFAAKFVTEHLQKAFEKGWMMRANHDKR